MEEVKLKVKPIELTFIGDYLPGHKDGGIIRNIVNTIDQLCDDFDFWVIKKYRDLGDEKAYDNIEINRWSKVGNAIVYYLSPKQNVVSEIGYLLKNAFEKILDDKNKWIHMGKLSGKLYDEIFNRKIALENFIERMNKFSVEKKM